MENKQIEVVTKPVIEYSVIENIGIQVDEKIKSLDLENLEINESSLSSVKKVRAELSRDFKDYEEKRKMVKDIILKPYNDFESKYKEEIAVKFKKIDSILKTKIDIVTDDILNQKIQLLKEYFNEHNNYDFVKFEDIGLKIIKSVTDKKIKDEINTYLENINISIETIDTLENKDRILAKFQVSKNLSDAISQTNLEIEREKKIKEQEEQKKLKQKEVELQSKMQTVETEVQKEEDCNPPIKEALKVFKSSFKVYGTREQFAELKKFMNEKGIRYE